MSTLHYVRLADVEITDAPHLSLTQIETCTAEKKNKILEDVNLGLVVNRLEIGLINLILGSK